MPQKDCENFRKDLKDRLKEAIHAVAGKPDGRVRRHSCLLRGKINEGKGASFDNVGRKYNVVSLANARSKNIRSLLFHKCTTAKHDHTWLPQYTTGPLPGGNDQGRSRRPRGATQPWPIRRRQKTSSRSSDAIRTITDKAFNDLDVYAETGHLPSSLPSTPSPLPSPLPPFPSPPGFVRTLPALPTSTLFPAHTTLLLPVEALKNPEHVEHSKSFPSLREEEVWHRQRLRGQPNEDRVLLARRHWRLARSFDLRFATGKRKRAPEPESTEEKGQGQCLKSSFVLLI
ncbi:hypothetical protein AAF712_009286 [Marasmius tenuissimus]|uniref:Uncharacterized protein n=1 Tax=Marasmius tenuissimus TaxID=585030 RepID=A0ABR2ZS97_9AGAR